MQKRILWILLGIAVFIMGFLIKNEEKTVKEIVLTKEISGQEIDVLKGDIIAVQIKENPTTGYSWRFEAEPREVLQEVENTFIPPDVKMVGAGGIRKVKYQSRAKGKAIVQGFYYRPWEEKPEKSSVLYKLNIQ